LLACVVVGGKKEFLLSFLPNQRNKTARQGNQQQLITKHFLTTPSFIKRYHHQWQHQQQHPSSNAFNDNNKGNGVTVACPFLSFLLSPRIACLLSCVRLFSYYSLA
jgi:hypothetical protein